MTIDDIYSKLSDLEDLIGTLSQIDYESKNIKNLGNTIVTNDNIDLKVSYARNSSLINNKTYDEFMSSMQDYLNPLIDDIKQTLIDANNNKPLSATKIKDWTVLEVDSSKIIDTFVLDSLDYTPSVVDVLVKLNSCSEKNGGDNGIIVKIPPIGVSIDGLPFDFETPKNNKNYSGWWVEDGQIKIFMRKADFPQWLGKCTELTYKLFIWR
jgi:hypothetical protein